MTDFAGMDDAELFFSVGSSRPRRGDLHDLIVGYTEATLCDGQRSFDAAVEEMHRRDAERGFGYNIPRSK